MINAFVRSMCMALGVEYAEVMASSRGCREASYARQIIIYCLIVEFGFSRDDVGKALGRDRATVIHALKRIEDLRGGDDALPHMISVKSLDAKMLR